jgi:hypothetical protein
VQLARKNVRATLQPAPHVNKRPATAELRDFELKLALGGLEVARAPAVAPCGQRVRSALVALAPGERIEPVLDGALDDQFRGEEASWLRAPSASAADTWSARRALISSKR